MIQGKSLFVATPMYGGQCFGAYTNAVMHLALLAKERGIPFKFCPLFNESHIDRGRNILADEFLTSGMSHLMFIDSDIEFEPADVIGMLDAEKDVLCGFYPKKAIDWARIVAAVKAGLADENPKVLQHYVGKMAFTPSLDDQSLQAKSIYDMVEVHEACTGFMMIQRQVLEKLAIAHPELTYLKNGEQKDEITCFFDAKIDPNEKPFKRHLSEDYDFCRLVRDAGMKIWLAPWMKLSHLGYYQFIGDVEAIGALDMKRAEAA